MIERIDAELLEVGDIVRVQHGGSPPADGTIVSGNGGAFDESSLTGESRLVKKQVGEDVFLGTINKGAVVDVRVNAIGGETMLDHVVKVVREGQTRRAPIERVADMITGYFVPVVTLLAVITWVVWLGLGLGGALPPSYLDIDVGGWGESPFDCMLAVNRNADRRRRRDTLTPCSRLVIGVRNFRIRRCMPMWYRAGSAHGVTRRFGSCREARYPRSRGWRSIPGGSAARHRCLRQDWHSNGGW